ncbi:MAG: CDP-alcohol phosphatidyltransferase family protein [Candidatus Omnitrophica bacterium]|nr:CDP-alcohol phosphatidyltransferase family protein [Candidatus Omnitrophota bacterium]
MNLANKITIARIILIPFFIASVIYSRLDIALVIFICAVISDGLDGFIARTMNQKTFLGTVLDPVADKLLLMSTFIVLAVSKSIPAGARLPAYVPIIVISRDALIVLGTVIIYFIAGDVKIEPSGYGKVTTFFQMMTIVSVLVHFRYSYVIWTIAIIFTAISGIDYLIKGSRMLNNNHAPQKKRQGEATWQR